MLAVAARADFELEIAPRLDALGQRHSFVRLHARVRTLTLTLEVLGTLGDVMRIGLAASETLTSLLRRHASAITRTRTLMMISCQADAQRKPSKSRPDVGQIRRQV